MARTAKQPKNSGRVTGDSSSPDECGVTVVQETSERWSGGGDDFLGLPIEPPQPIVDVGGVKVGVGGGEVFVGVHGCKVALSIDQVNTLQTAFGRALHAAFTQVHYAELNRRAKLTPPPLESAEGLANAARYGRELKEMGFGLVKKAKVAADCADSEGSKQATDGHGSARIREGDGQ